MSNQKKNVESEEITLPSWLNTESIQEALNRDGGDLKITGLSACAAIAPGENYGSSLYRLKVTLADGEKKSLIVKELPTTAAMANTIVETGIFQREGTMLARVFPQMETLLEAAAPGRYQPFAPRCLMHGCDPDFYIVMEDLAPQGFRIANRHRGLGLRHCLLALRTLARYHAAGAALLQKDPSVANGLSNPWSPPHEAFKNMTEWGVKGVLEVCRTWAGMEEVTRCLEAFEPVAFETLANVRNPKPGAFNVFIHGDFWVNNFMFSYEDGQPKDVRFVDFQSSQVASAALDLLYFLSICPSEDISIHYEDLLLREYHTALVETMEILGLQPLPLEALYAELDAHGVHALFGAFCAFPAIKFQKVLDTDAALSNDNDSALECFKQPIVKRWLQRLLPKFRHKGWLPG